MSYFGYGRLAGIGLVAIIGLVGMADRGMNYASAKATVFRIDRECGFTRRYEGGKQEQVREDCGSTGEFKEIASHADKRKEDVEGKAVVKVSYTAPQDGSYHTSELRFDGRDDQFYTLKAGDEVAILVSNDDPNKIRLD
jgi:hypothetical protein